MKKGIAAAKTAQAAEAQAQTVAELREALARVEAKLDALLTALTEKPTTPRGRA